MMAMTRMISDSFVGLSCPDLARYNHAMQTLVKIVQDICYADSVSRIVEIVKVSTRQLLEADGITLILKEGDQCHYIAEDAIAPLWVGMKFPLNHCIGGWAILHQEPVIIQNIYEDDRVPLSTYKSTFIKSLMMIPIHQQDIIGAIGCYWAQLHTPTPEEVQLVQAIASTTGIAMEKVQVYEKLEEKIKLYAEELQLAYQELETFSHSLSHDLRNPLAIIKGFSELLERRYHNLLDEAGNNYVDRIHSSALKMNEQIEEILLFHRVQKAPLNPQWVDITLLSEDIIESFKLKSEERVLEINIAEGLGAEADSGLLKIVLDNLLSNAWKYTSKKEKGLIEVGELPDQETPTFYVKDNGAGFDMSHVEDLFKPFKRLHGEAEFHGNGIGLTAVQRIIERHGGRIWATGKVEEGATFYFTLSASRDFPKKDG